MAEYFDPLDGLGWRAAVIDYSVPASPRRQAQLSRLTGWRPATWEDHFASVDALIAETKAAGERSSDAATPIRLASHRARQVDRQETADVR